MKYLEKALVLLGISVIVGVILYMLLFAIAFTDFFKYPTYFIAFIYVIAFGYSIFELKSKSAFLKLLLSLICLIIFCLWADNVISQII
jgi:high-affinity Fe2+/Pb2+ permease